MKNKFYEGRKKSAEAYMNKSKRRQLDPKYGIQIYHCYDNPRELSYWDDVAFFTKKQKVVIFWTHPRYEYSEHNNSIAYEIAFPKTEVTKDIFEPTKTVFKKVGKSRKKAAFYEMGNLRVHDESVYDHWRSEEKRLNETGEYEQKCFFKIVQADYARQVSICIPVEVRNQTELVALVDIVKNLLKNPTSFRDIYGEYRYTKEDFIRERK